MPSNSFFRAFLLFSITFYATGIFAQQTEEQAIKGTIDTLFIALQQGDSSLARTCFDSSARLQTALINPVTGNTKLQNESLSAFLQQVASIKKSDRKLEERIISYDINIDLPLASVWAIYEFYVDGKLSHKGVDAFQLFKSKDGWKIIQICDTRKK